MAMAMAMSRCSARDPAAATQNVKECWWLGLFQYAIPVDQGLFVSSLGLLFGQEDVLRLGGRVQMGNLQFLQFSRRGRLAKCSALNDRSGRTQARVGW